MEKWEYLDVYWNETLGWTVNGEKFDFDLKRLGDYGWELVSVLPLGDKGEVSRLFFKRHKE